MSRYLSWLASFQALLVSLLIHSNTVLALSWRGRSSTQPVKEKAPDDVLGYSASQLLRPDTQSLTSYEIALNELQELESEPLCHRIAARLLVHNCQVLEGKDEATILTDSGRRIRDFVDSYAASLAICDLERGRFNIPSQCINFREPALRQLPIQDVAHLHVTSSEIDGCLSGLGASDSAWNTWVSYRHKALRFCEAARADNEKDQSIMIFQRLTKIMSKLSDDVDVKIEQRMNDIDFRTQAVGENIEALNMFLEKLRQDLESADDMVSSHLVQGIRKSQDKVESGLESAVNLERVLQMMLRGVVDSHAEVAVVHDQSLQLLNQRVASEIDNIVGSMAAAMVATVSIQNQLEVSRIQAADLESRQGSLEQGMQRLLNMSDDLAERYDVHADSLDQARSIASDIIETLEDTAASVAAIGDSYLGQYSLKSWWLYIWCPVASLVMGSYGLPPSLLRNFALVALGEAAGFVISSLSSLSFDGIRIPNANPLELFTWPMQRPTTSQNLTNISS